MTHKGTVVLETKRLLLRPFVLEDAPAMYENWASDQEVTRFMTWPAHTGVDISAWVLSDWVGHYEEKNNYQWAIVPKALGQPIGSISVVRMDEACQSVEIGYCIGRAWWHQGITSEALEAVICFLFAEVGVKRIQARHDPNNPHSGGVMKKCGMTFEGIHRQADRNNQGICDSCVYAILASEAKKQPEVQP